MTDMTQPLGVGGLLYYFDVALFHSPYMSTMCLQGTSPGHNYSVASHDLKKVSLTTKLWYSHLDIVFHSQSANPEFSVPEAVTSKLNWTKYGQAEHPNKLILVVRHSIIMAM